jgi:hypothetical protein
VEIIHAQFLTAGIPSGLSFSGEFDIGKTTGQLALNVSEDPMRRSFLFMLPDSSLKINITGEFLYVEVKKLEIEDIVAFTAECARWMCHLLRIASNRGR